MKDANSYTSKTTDTSRDRFVYSSIYELSKDYYKRDRIKNIFKTVYKIVMALLILLSLSGIIFYSAAIKPYIDRLKTKIYIWS